MDPAKRATFWLSTVVLALSSVGLGLLAQTNLPMRNPKGASPPRAHLTFPQPEGTNAAERAFADSRAFAAGSAVRGEAAHVPFFAPIFSCERSPPATWLLDRLQNGDAPEGDSSDRITLIDYCDPQNRSIGSPLIKWLPPSQNRAGQWPVTHALQRTWWNEQRGATADLAAEPRRDSGSDSSILLDGRRNSPHSVSSAGKGESAEPPPSSSNPRGFGAGLSAPRMLDAGSSALVPSTEVWHIQQVEPSPLTEPLPSPQFPQMLPYVEPVFDEFLDAQMYGNPGPPPGFFQRMAAQRRQRRANGGGMGRDYLPFALVAITPAQPATNFRFRFDSVYGLTLPDRAEMFWARPSNLPGGRGPPAPESSVRYQDFVFIPEIGNSKFSVTTELPIRMLDPRVNLNTAGFGDMNIITKLVLMNGESLLLTQYFRVKPPTGAFQKGLGNGNTVLDPGVLMRYKLSDDSYLHSQFSYAFPLGGYPSQQGQVLLYDVGVNRVLFDSDTFAVIPSLEFTGMTFLDGQQATFNGVTVDAVNVDTTGVFHIFPGVRLVAETGGDMGVFELGFGAGINMGSVGWYDDMTRMILRWSR